MHRPKYTLIHAIWKYYKNIRHLSFSSCIFKWDFSYFLKLIHILTSFVTLCSAIWRKKRFKQSQEPQKRIFYIGKHRNPYIVHFKVTKIRNFNNVREIIHKLTLFLTLCSVVWRQKRFKQSQELQKILHRKTSKSIYWPFSGNKNSRL